MACCLVGVAPALGQTAPVFTEVPPAQLDLTSDQQRLLAKIQGEPAAAEVAVVRLNPAELRPGPAPLRMFSNRDVTLALPEAQPRGVGARMLSSGPARAEGSATLFVRGALVTGRVVSGDRVYSIRPLGGGLHAVVTVDQARLPPEHPESFDRLEQAPRDAPPAPERRGDAAAGDVVPVIDVLVAYTPAVGATWIDPHALAQFAVDQMNRSFANSGVAANVRLVYSTQLAYSEAAGFEAAITHLVTPGDGQLDEVQWLRDQTGADIVALLIDNEQLIDTPLACGLAADIMAAEITAFTVVDDDCAVDNLSFSHELGHLLGARHNPEADPNSLPFPHGHGYQDPAGLWRTVMAYDCETTTCPRIELWSNPNLSIDGRPTGTAATHDNTRMLNQTVGMVAGYRTTAVGLSVANFAYEDGSWRVEEHPRFLADLTGDGKADVVGFDDRGVWVSASTGSGFATPARWAANYAYDTDSWRVEEHPRFLADLTGDGKADVAGFDDRGVWVSASYRLGLRHAGQKGR